jgi:hypothetical protein
MMHIVSTRRKLVMAAAACALLAVLGAGTGLAVGSQPAPRAPVPHGYSGINDPRLLACEHAKRVCNAGAASRKQIMAEPFTQPLPAHALLITKLTAERLARQTVHATPNAPAFAQLMTGSQLERRFGMPRDQVVNEARPVWVVTVRATVVPDSPVPMPAKHFYTAIIDAASGILTDDCLGCDWIRTG